MKNIIILLLTALFSFSLFGQRRAEKYVEHELIIMLKHGVDPAAFSHQEFAIGGNQIHLKIRKALSKTMNIYLFQWFGEAPDQEIRHYFEFHQQVELAQFNHFTELRVLPNDPSFGTQWDKHNTGQGNGTMDADMDAPEAWDITTGGFTSHGDTIVVAVIDDGFYLPHEDLRFFKNKHEIPNNNIDDDGNGYIDDYDGWNSWNSDGNISSSSHGTHTSGIVGALGNNGKGVSGVNWNVQIMPIQGASTTESETVEAYAYIRDMRMLYDQTNGDKGAFVVATNSSFGIDFANPANYPIWCAMYDSLGQLGILSAVSTMNNNSNVDTQGDVPSTCASPWMIAVTSTNRNDNKANFSAFGKVHIDLGAPGESILSTVTNNNYGQQSGTSMASPQVAGAVALLISAGGPDLISNYKANPSAWALTFKDIILNTTDSIPDLFNKSVSAGRLNLFNSVDSLQKAYPDVICHMPFGFNATNQTDSSMTVNWVQVDSALNYAFRYREKGTSTWMTGNTAGTSVPLGSLKICTDYEFEVSSNCPADSSSYSPTTTLKTEGCCDAPATVSTDSIGEDLVTISWGDIFASTGYHVRIREKGTTTWTDTIVLTDPLTFYGLKKCTEYEYQIETNCDTLNSNFTALYTFTTSGCGQCVEGGYCSSQYNSQDEYIDEVKFDAMTNTSGDDNGYGDYTSISITVIQGLTYNISLTPGYGFLPYNEYFKIFIDFNGDGDFNDAGETAYDAGGTNNSTVLGTVTIPVAATVGKTRMRVMMRWDVGPTICQNGEFGEVEDYCMDILQYVGRVDDAIQQISVYPNPSSGRVTIQSSSIVDGFQLLDLSGKLLYVDENRFSGERQFSLKGLADGVYFLRVNVDGQMITRKLIKE